MLGCKKRTSQNRGPEKKKNTKEIEDDETANRRSLLLGEGRRGVNMDDFGPQTRSLYVKTRGWGWLVGVGVVGGGGGGGVGWWGGGWGVCLFVCGGGGGCGEGGAVFPPHGNQQKTLHVVSARNIGKYGGGEKQAGNWLLISV